MFKKMEFKKIIVSVLFVLMLLLTACNANENVNSNTETSGGQSQIQNDSSKPNGITSKPSAEVDTLKPNNTGSETLEEIKKNHKDDDNNGRCDKCNESVLVYIDLFAVNDLHGKICDSASQPGVDELTSYFKLMYEKEDNVVVLSNGDMWQGSSESNLTRGHLTTEWMNYIGFESMTVGNHEYDWGSAAIADNAKVAKFPLLAINVYSRDDNKQVDYCQSSVLIERNGIKIGIIGAAGDNYSSIATEMSKDVYFKTGKELTSLVKAESEKLKKQGAQIIVYSIHDGYGKSSSGTGMIADDTLKGYYDATLSSGGYVDVVFEAHTHQNYVLKDAYGVYHLQGGGENKGISHVEIAVNAVNLNKRVTEAEFISNTIYSYLGDDPIVEALLKKYENELEISNKLLGRNPSYKSSDDIGRLVAQLYYEAGVERWGNKYQIVLGGGSINTRNPYNLAVGDVTYSQLLSLLPFDNDLALCSIKGSDLQKNFFNRSSYFIYYDEYGQGVKNNIQANKTYYIIADSWSYGWEPNKLTVVEKYDPNVYARDLLAQYILDGRLK
ncbi:MAG: 5'-nucleotidase C-terminal domain-containing protein [Clostridia bacterium]|nr:5'-nucleotidase C-terminal domain-containing protein [Clostridia bacterium]